MNSFIPFIWKTYALVVLGISALTILFRIGWLKKIEDGADSSEIVILGGIGRSLCELFLSATLWLASAILVASQFDNRFFFGLPLQDYDDFVFLVCSALVMVTPLYSLMWALECMFKSHKRILQDAERRVDDRHLTILVERLSFPLILLAKLFIKVGRGYTSYIAKRSAKP